jgi:hypothetical protein
MRKLLLIALGIPTLSFAFGADLDMNRLYCRDMKITSATTLQEVRNKCLLRSQDMGCNGLYQVKFRNDATQDDVTCNFATTEKTSLLNGCK